MALTSIYNFVPLNKNVYHPSWANQVSQDIPFSDAEDGIIEVTLTNISPLFIRNGTAAGSERGEMGSSIKGQQSIYSAHICQGDKKLYFLPGSSLKGMLRTTLEILSFGKMNQFANRYFSCRDLGGRTTSESPEYVKLMKNVRAGWLKKEGEDFYLTPCDGDFERIDYSEIEKSYPKYMREKSAWEKNEALGFYPYYKFKGDTYRIVCTGDIKNKHKEFLFPNSRLEKIKLENKVKEAFKTVHEPTPHFEEMLTRLDSGQELAVFYTYGQEKDIITAVGVSRMFRYPYKQSVKMLVNKQQLDNDIEQHDLCELIFGYIEGDGLKGRVQIGNAFSDEALTDDKLLPIVSGVLGQPKASYYPLYLQQEHSPYKTYNDADAIAGRKLYRVHRGGTTTMLPEGNRNQNLETNFKPLPPGQHFHLKISVHNLRPVEVGALLSALTLHNTKNTWHNIGLAKGYGYGKLELSDIKLKGFRLHKEDYIPYLKDFESEMTYFCLTKVGQKWIDTPQITTLMSILGEHDDQELKAMELKNKNGENDFTKNRKTEYFSQLTEKTVPVKSLLNDTEINLILQQANKLKNQKLKSTYKEKNTGQYSLVHKLTEDKKWDEAVKQYETIIKDLLFHNLNTDEENKAIEEIKTIKRENQEKILKETTDNENAKKEEQHKNGLGSVLDATYPMGSNQGKFKIPEWKICHDRLPKWMKEEGRKVLNDEEKTCLIKTVKRLYAHPTKREKKDWTSFSSKIWSDIRSYLGDAIASDIFYHKI
jgi:CRISPR/Cas system CSM-associated protein Csm3 (group 7 of RAMP superfamily)